MRIVDALVLDVDGTIVDTHGVLVPTIRIALDKVWDEVPVVLASGRSPGGVCYIQTQLSRTGRFIALNGAVLGDARGRLTAVSRELPQKVLVAIAEARRECGNYVCGVFAYSLHRWWAHGDRWTIDAEALATQNVPEVCEDEGAVLGLPAIKMTVVCANSRAQDRFCVELGRRVGGSCEIERSKAGYVEITNAGVSKGKALVSLMRSEGWKQVISVGDGVNDVSMFKVSSSSYAMPWAAEEVRMAAENVIAMPGHACLARLILGL